MSFGGVPVVTLHVGPDKVVFHVHENLLLDASPVFKAAFSGSFKEASTRSMSLLDDDKNSVERLTKWLYTKKLDLTTPVSKETSEECYMQLAKLNTLAEKYDIHGLKNDIVDELFELGRSPKDIEPPQVPVVKEVYDNTTERSSFRKLMVAWYAYNIDFEWYGGDDSRTGLAGVSQDFAIDLARELGLRLENRDRKSAFTLPSKAFHETSSKEADEKST